MIKITFPDKTVREFESGIKAIEIAESISKSFVKKVMSACINGVESDLRTNINEDSTVQFYTFDDNEGKDAFWHTSSHVLAQAVKRLYPQAKLAIGPAIDAGFYYDFDVDVTFTPEILEQIEEEMRKIIKENPLIQRYVLSREEALSKEREADEIYKVELIDGLDASAEISFYEQGDFFDMCTGPHLMDLSVIKAVKLLSLAGAYWRGDEKNKMLQRIYGITFPKQSQLDEYLEMIEEAKKRDHRKLGRELDLYSLMDEGPGFPFFHPKGMVIRNELENFWREEHVKRGYEEIKTPIILDADMWRRSGHWDNYKENMYFTKIDEREFAVKPMNCPGGMLLYNRMMHSYKELPIRYAELGIVHRHEKSGALHGLMRVRNFTQDDAHIFMSEDQIVSEVSGVIDFIDYIYSIFGFEYAMEVSTKPEKSIGTDEQWEFATNALIEVLESRGDAYKINPGDGAFYGPKIDFHLKDSIGRTWQCGTIQLDFQMPERFDLNYIGSDGEKHRPVVIHRVIFGSIERFIGILTEHFAGAFPTWLAPIQARIITVNEAYIEYGRTIMQKFRENGIRIELDDRNEKLGYKIREAQMQKIPYMFVIGEKEQEANQVNIRTYHEGNEGAVETDVALERLLNDIDTKRFD